MRYSFIVPLYNRPEEMEELLASLVQQTHPDFEVVVVEDGSKPERSSAHIVQAYSNRLSVHYHSKPNSGPGLTRNVGMQLARGEWFIILDSDVILPPDYLEKVHRFLAANPDVDCFGGPDASHESFSQLDHAISFSMTSLWTTGGIRGRKRQFGGDYHPRSFNLGMRRRVFEATGGFAFTRQGEDLDLSIRIRQLGFQVAYLPEAVVFHKRRATLKRFYRQVYNFGQARWGISRLHKGTLRPLHLLPAVFVLYVWGLLAALAVLLAWAAGLQPEGSKLLPFVWGWLGLAAPLAVFKLLVFQDALRRFGRLNTARLCVLASFVQLYAYGCGFMWYWFQRQILRDPVYRL